MQLFSHSWREKTTTSAHTVRGKTLCDALIPVNRTPPQYLSEVSETRNLLEEKEAGAVAAVVAALQM